jgi:hypothetical protein
VHVRWKYCYQEGDQTNAGNKAGFRNEQPQRAKNLQDAGQEYNGPRIWHPGRHHFFHIAAKPPEMADASKTKHYGQRVKSRVLPSRERWYSKRTKYPKKEHAPEENEKHNH